jgi:hypothetical protein
MGFSPFKKSDKDSSEARTPTPPEYDNSHAGDRLPSVAREELEGLTLYEKKCVLINREIDNNGFGKYQWYIWSLCGLGYFIDLIWAQAFGLILGPLQQELGFPGMSPNMLCNECPKLTSINTGDQSGNISVRSSIPAVSRATDF